MQNITINGQIYTVNDESLTGLEIKALAGLGNDQLFRLDGDQRVTVEDNERIELGTAEHFVGVPPAAQADEEEPQKTITIYVDGDPHPTDDRVLTGVQIKALAKKPAGNRLFRLAGEGQRIQIADDEKVHLHEGEQFVTLPPVGRAS